MRTTVKLDASKSVVIDPSTDGVVLSIRLGAYLVGSATLSDDQIGALLDGLERAAAESKAKQARIQ